MSGTCRILSLDGGGERGYISAVFLELFCTQWGINPNTLWQHFDVICGTSVGGIQAIAYANGTSPSEAQSFFTEDGPWIFSTSDVIPSQRPSTASKINTMVFGGTFYPNTRLISTLDTEFGDLLMSDLKTNVVIPSYNFDTDTPTLFSNVDVPGYTGQEEYLKNVALATSSAPLYFPAANFGGVNYVDGAICQNNPAELGLSLAKFLKKTADRFCILSVGTGLGDIGFHSSSSGGVSATAFENMEYIFKLLDIGIAGPQEITSFDMNMQDKYTLQNIYNYRFNFQLTTELDADIDNTDPDFIEYMHDATVNRYNEDISNISTFLGHLTA